MQEKVLSDPRPYILKPNDKGEGNGIFVAETLKQLDEHDLAGHVAQPLLTDPYLIQGKKFDFRSVPLCKPVLSFLFCDYITSTLWSSPAELVIQHPTLIYSLVFQHTSVDNTYVCRSYFSAFIIMN